MPTVTRPGPACSAEPSEPSVSASTQDAPPCSSPYGWVLPSTGMVPTTRSGDAATILMPIRPGSDVLPGSLNISMICCSRSDETDAEISTFPALKLCAVGCQTAYEPRAGWPRTPALLSDPRTKLRVWQR